MSAFHVTASLPKSRWNLPGKIKDGTNYEIRKIKCKFKIHVNFYDIGRACIIRERSEDLHLVQRALFSVIFSVFLQSCFCLEF